MRKWREGNVEAESDHIKIRYKDNETPIALVTNQNGNITVQFHDEVLKDKIVKKDVIEELDLYFGKLNEEDPWSYAIYHCSTASNVYSNVHWGYYPKGYKGR